MGKSCIIVAFMLLVMIQSSLSLIKCKTNELEALLKFKQSFTQDPMNRLSSWVADDCCHWLGVTCDDVTGNVIKLNLRSESRYIGSLVCSELSSALLELKFLTHLDLSFNDFNESQIPKFIGSMSNLRYLNLSHTGFSGRIPPQLGNLTNLMHLDLTLALGEWGFLSKDDSLWWAHGLTKLISLKMDAIDLSETNDTSEVLFRLPSLLKLSLADCSLQNTHLVKVLTTNTSNTLSSTLQHLDLSKNGFEGPFPSFLKNMCSLQHLDLSLNDFENPFPSFLLNMTSLQHLDLSENVFEGPFPSFLKNMLSLQHLDLSQSAFRGRFSTFLNKSNTNKGLNGSVPHWLRNLRHLDFLKLNGNSFTYVEGGIWGIMGNPCNFKYLDLSYNLIVQEDMGDPFVNSTGTCNAYELEHLSLSYNGFQGPIPASLAKLTALTHLDLSNNRLSGLMTDVLGNLTELKFLDISSNSIQGTASGICNLSKLSYLDMSFNNLNLAMSFNCQPLFQLQVFNVHSCKINTAIPEWLRNQTQLYRLDLSNTGVSGELPSKWLWNLSNIELLHLSDNQLTGSLPRHIACDGCNLGVLELNNNTLTGTIPHWLRNSKTTVAIDLSGNLLSGAILEGGNTSLFNSLTVLDLSDNMLSGEIQIKNVYPGASMQFLSLRGNNFSGPISSQLCHYPNLQMLELAHNRLTGHIPRCLGSLLFGRGGGTTFDNVVEIREMIKGVTQQLAGTEWTHSIIDLSSNHLIGTIPEQLTNLSNLMELYLSNNHLTGEIPRGIGHLQLLESLDLSNNNLSGTIPQNMSAIFGLSFLNLSNNHLHGPIPTGRQLQTLVDPSIYAGNSGLCGFPLPDKCIILDPLPSPTSMDPDVGEEDKHEKMWFYLVIMSGVAVGFWGVVGTLVFKKSWRHAYFWFVEETADKIYLPVKVRVNRYKNSRQRKKTRTENSLIE